MESLLAEIVGVKRSVVILVLVSHIYLRCISWVANGGNRELPVREEAIRHDKDRHRWQYL
jgi:hypothetical protein